jgi:predicted nucleic acid-binding protein
MGAQVVKAAYLLDSTVLIDHLRGIEKATRWLLGLRGGEAAISVITRAEVLCGGTEEEAAAAFRLCDQFDCLPLTRDEATKAAELRRKNGWKLPDAFQAATAMRHDLKLVTRNSKDFDDAKLPFILVPYKLP